MSKSQRRHRRVPVRIPVLIQTARGERSALTEDISVAGVFIRSENPQTIRSLVRLRVSLGDGEELRLLGMVAHVVSPADAAINGKQSGMGLNLYGLADDVRSAWESFVFRKADEFDAVSSGAHLAARVLNPEPKPIALSVRVGDHQALERIANASLTEGLFVPTPQEMPSVERRVRLTMVHDESEAEFVVHGVVIGQVDAPQAGVHVRVSRLTPPQRASFQTFMDSAIPLLDDDMMLET